MGNMEHWVILKYLQIDKFNKGIRSKMVSVAFLIVIFDLMHLYCGLPTEQQGSKSS